MDEAILDGVNESVGERDTLYHLGDFAFGGKSRTGGLRAMEHYRSRIRCRNVHIVWGNHDGLPSKARHEAAGRLFSTASDLTQVNVCDLKIVLCHYAMAAWNGSHHGAWQLYGHSHSSLEPWMNAVMPGRRSMDVGVDNAKLLLGDYRPFSLDELKGVLDGRPNDHHGS